MPCLQGCQQLQFRPATFQKAKLFIRDDLVFHTEVGPVDHELLS